jgi:hypothetical protein
MRRLSTFPDVANHCAGWLLARTGIDGLETPSFSPNNGLKTGTRLMTS